jgi:type I restriction enzyme, S subunit
VTVMEEDSLPIGWRLVKIKDVYDSWGGLTPSKANPTYWGPGLPWLSSREVKGERLETSTFTVTPAAVEETNLRICPPGSVLVVVRSGILARMLPVGMTQVPVVINQDLKAFYSTELLMNEWLALFLRSRSMELLASSRRDGTTVQSIQYTLLQNTLMPVPPIEERRRILSAIGALLDRQASVLPHLHRSRADLEQFRKAVLTAACSGRLTTDWRDGHPHMPSLEQALADLPPRKRARKVADAPIDLQLPDLPDSYLVATIGQAAQVIEYGTSESIDTDSGGVPVLRMGNIQDGRLDLSDLKYHELDAEIQKLLLHDGDLLFNRTNSPELVGKSAVYRGEEPMSFASYLIRVRLAPDICDPDFANYWINSAWGRAWAYLAKTDGVSQSNINGTKLAAMPIPLPPIKEQREIVRRASKLLATSEGLLARVARSEQAVESSALGILAKAFRGDITSIAA